MHDPVSQLLTSIRNAATAGLRVISLDHSILKEAIAQVLMREGYLGSVKVDGGKIKRLTIELKYVGRTSVISNLKQVSTPGLRRYVGFGEIPRVLGGMGSSILSTPKGVMSGFEAYRGRHGGELLCFVW